MRYVMSRLAREQEDLAYRIYVTDSLKAIGNLNRRYYDFIKKVPEETRTSSEIIGSIKRKLKEM